MTTSNPKKILVVNLAGIGDIVVSSPALRALKEAFRHDNVYLLTFRDSLELVKDCPYIKEAFLLEKKFAMRNFEELLKMRSRRFDIAINLYNIHSLKGALKMFALFRLLNPKKSVGRDTDKRGFFYDIHLAESSPSERPDVETMLDVAGLLGAKSDSKELEIWLKPDTATVEHFLSRNDISEKDRIVCLHPGARDRFHRWPVESFAGLADELIKKYGVKIIITGSKKERPLARDMVGRMDEKKSAHIASGEFSLSQLAGCLRKSEVFITNDTGPMHIANALGVPMVVISGRTPKAFLPYRKEKTVVLRKEPMDSAGGLGSRRENHRSLKRISCEDVMAAVAVLFERS